MASEVEALLRGYEALNRGDFSLVLELLDPEIEWHEPDPSPDAGTHRGRDSFERFFRGWVESFEGFRVVPERVLEREGTIVAVVHQMGRGRSSGVEVEARLAHVWTVENGRAVRWEAVGDPDRFLRGDG